MRFGRTSVVNFVSQLVMSLTGFLATIVLTNVLGRDIYGSYVVALSLLSWLLVVGNFGILQAVKKRISESNEGNYVVAGLVFQLGLFAVISLSIVGFRTQVNQFVGVPVWSLLILMLGTQLAFNYVQAVLDGQDKVHISSVLSPLQLGVRSVGQVVLVLGGFSIVGAFYGFIAGGLVATLLGGYFLNLRLSMPCREDVASITTYARFSWLSPVKGRSFLSMDTLILAFFVAKGLIAVYEVAWNIASLFAIFGSSIRRSLFPGLSRLSSEDASSEMVPTLVNASLVYTGLFMIPGLVGSAIIGDVILTVYGEGFQTGYNILLILTFARMLYDYQSQFENAMDAVDHPELTFRVNVVFVMTNLLLNVLLVWQFGWYGAAVATTVSAGVGVLLSYYYARRVLQFNLPVTEIGKQWFAAGLMGMVVYAGRVFLAESVVVALVLALIGAGVYLVTLLGLSGEFRRTVADNVFGA